MEPANSIKTARERGMLRYHLGRPCRKGHNAERYTYGDHAGRCVDCINAGFREQYKPTERGEVR